MFNFDNKPAKGNWNNLIDEAIDSSDLIIPIIDINNLIDEEMNKFKQTEQIGRTYCLSWLNELGATNIEFSADPYECVDVDFTYKNKNITAEIKVRDEKYKNYSTHLMEVNKYMNIMNYKTTNNKDGALYINFFGENWVYVYSVNQISTTFIKSKELVVTTVEDNGTKQKDIIEIPTDLAQIYYRKNKESKWKRIK